MTHTPTRGPLYDELARRINALVGSAPEGAQGELMHLVTLTGEFESAEGIRAKVRSISKVDRSASLLDITLDLGLDLNDTTIAEAKSQLQRRLHGTVQEALSDGPYLKFRYDSRPDRVYMEWAQPAANYIRDVLQEQGPLSKFDQEFDRPITTTVGTKTQTMVRVTRRMGEAGFTVRITPNRKQCLPNGKTWTEDGAIAAIKYCLPGYQVTSVIDYSNQQIIATVTSTTL